MSGGQADTRLGARSRRMVGLVGALLVIAEPALACPNCKDGLSGFEMLARAFNNSIMFMMVMPFALAALVGGSLYYRHRQRRLHGEEHEE